MRPRRSTISFLALLAPVVFVGGAPAPAVAGTPPSAILEIVPVPAKVGAYPGGTTIVGNELTAFTGGFRAWFEVKLSNWDPNGDGVPALKVYQVKIDCSGYLDADAPGDQPDLAPPVIPCTNDAAGNTLCRNAFGEVWAKCESGTCKAGYDTGLGTNRPADNWCAPNDCDQADVATGGSCNYTYFGIYPTTRFDGGIEYYGGTLVLDIPAGAEGRYTVNLNVDQTFLADTGIPPNIIPVLSKTGFVVNIVQSTVQACCLNAGGCTDMDAADCANAGDTPQGAGTDCLNDQCTPPTGACCDMSTASCTDDVLQADCSPPLEWTGGTLCVNLPSPCLPTGACCDSSPGAGGTCTDSLFEVDCMAPNEVWTANTACTEVICAEVVGACCDSSPGAGGLCSDGLLQAQCTGPQQVWSQGAACTNIVCEEARGSCCNTTTFTCTSNVLQAGCLGADLVWRMGDTCGICAPGPQILLVPVAAKVGSYPAGTTIVGNELTALTGGFRAWFEVKLANWDPDGDDNPALRTYQIKIDCSGYADADAPGDQPDLAPPVIPCTDDAAGNTLCRNAFGEVWAKCESGTCKAGYNTPLATNRPADNYCAPNGCDAADVATVGSCNYAYFGVYSGTRFDGSIAYYGGTLVLDIPAGAVGKYTVNLLTDETFLADTGSPPNFIPTFAETGFVVNIVPPPLIVWDPNDAANRAIILDVDPPTVATGVLADVALKVTMVDLQHPKPRNLPLSPTRNITGFDTDSDGVCTVGVGSGNYNGHHCHTDTDCQSRCTNNAACGAGGVCNIPAEQCASGPINGTCSSLLACSEAASGAQGACARWVGPIQTFMESNDVQRRGMWRGAYLQCTPYYRDWTTMGRFGILGAEILPSSRYTVAAVTKTGFEGTPVAVTTRRSGDLFAPFQDETVPQTRPPVAPSSLDGAALRDKFRSAPGAVRKWLALLQGGLWQGPLGVQDVNSLDIVQWISAFRGPAYPWPGPCTCPSTMSCASATCTSASTCPGGLAAAACIKYCSTGPLTGRPCSNTTSCGVCTAGTTSAVDAFCESNAECGAGGACNLSNGRCTAGTLSLIGALCDSGSDCGTSGVCDAGVCGEPGNLGRCRDACGRCN